MNTMETPYGTLVVEGPVDRYADGGLRAVHLAAACPLQTSAGRLVPQYSIDDSRRMHKPPLTFHPNGRVRSMPLETRQSVATPCGELAAELVTFHDNGAVARIFPLNGKLTGFWTEADETALAETLALDTPIGPLAAKYLAVAFDPEGRLRSLTLWPGDVVTVPTPAGEAPVRLGLSFHADGSLRSVEPARPLETQTPVGPVLAYDPDAVGISGDDNSLEFTPAGGVARVATVRTALTVRLADGGVREFAPSVRDSICGDGDHELTPLVLEFSEAAVVARHGTGRPLAEVARQDAVFATRPFIAAFSVSLTPKTCFV